MPHIFVYGTLLAPEMMSAVTGNLFRSVPAAVRGYRRAYLAGRVYPGIVQDEASEVPGAVYLDVDRESLCRLDFFEGPEYVRGTLTAQLDDGQEVLSEAYIIPPANAHLLTEIPWTLEYFLAQDLSAFVERAKECMEVYEPGKSADRSP